MDAQSPFAWPADEVLPLGRVEHLRIDGDNLIGTPVFDETDPFAQRIKAKWEAGVLKMVSAGLDVLEQSDAPEDLVAGQKYATVTRCRLREVSIVDIGVTTMRWCCNIVAKPSTLPTTATNRHF